MEYHSVGPGGVMVSGNNVPAFLTKLWTLVEDPDTDPLICWSPVSLESDRGLQIWIRVRFICEELA